MRQLTALAKPAFASSVKRVVSEKIHTPPPWKIIHEIENLWIFDDQICWKDLDFGSKSMRVSGFFDFTEFYGQVTPMEESTSNLKVWIFPNFFHYPRILHLSPLLLGDLCIPSDFLFHWGQQKRS